MNSLLQALRDAGFDCTNEIDTYGEIWVWRVSKRKQRKVREMVKEYGLASYVEGDRIIIEQRGY